MLVPIVIAALLIFGIGVHHFSGKNDSPLEQLTEQTLTGMGVDIDFSKSKKEQQEKED